MAQWAARALASTAALALALGLGVAVPEAGASTASGKTRADGAKPARQAAAKPTRQSAAKPTRQSSAAKSTRSASRATKASPRKTAQASPRKTAQATRGKAVAGKKAVAPAGQRPGASSRSAPARAVPVVAAAAATVAARQSIGQIIGLHESRDPLSLHSAVALAVDVETGEILFEKNARAVLPIASISKLMTAMVVLEAGLPLDESLTISEADIDTEKFTRSRLRPGTVLTRNEMLQLALMASENRAANALGRHFPGGLEAFVARMNDKARELGMETTWFVEPTGLSSRNVSSALDLARLVRAASAYPLIRDYSTAESLTVASGARQVSFRNTNRLVARDDWNIGVQKTGYISEAGNCLVMQARVEGRPVVLVFLDATGKLSRFGDAQRLRSWLEDHSPRSDGMPRAAMRFSADS
jgi:D-alanyl-D-alanine endopeptidase (penicillin-binding protein 7)